MTRDERSLSRPGGSPFDDLESSVPEDAWTGEPDQNAIDYAERLAAQEVRTTVGGCYSPMVFRDIRTRCVLDKGHKGPCRNYAHVLNLNVPQNHPIRRGKRG